jgi:hypothetical protein
MNCDKQICIQVPALNGDENFGTLTASDGIYTSKIYDACGNLRIDLACSECDGAQSGCTDVVKNCNGEEVQIVALIEKSTGAVIPYTGCDQINAILRAGNGSCWKVQTVTGERLNLNSIKCCERLCEDLPSTIYGGLNVEGTICADVIGCCDIPVYDSGGNVIGTKCTDLIGNGCEVTNTDNTELIDFIYHPDNKYNVNPSPDAVPGGELELITQNTKDCGTVIPPEHFTLNTDEFTHNTWVSSFEFVPTPDSDELVLKDTDGREYSVDLEKYNNKQETYIEEGTCSTDGIISMDYNTQSPLYGQQVKIDISAAMRTISYTEYDKCTGKLTLCHDNGECIVTEGLPTNINIMDELPLGGEWSGHVYFHIRDNVIMVNVNVALGNSWPWNNVTPSKLGKLPVNLANYITSDDAMNDNDEVYVYKWLAGQSTTSVPTNYPFQAKYVYVGAGLGNYENTVQSGFVYVGPGNGDYIYDGYISPAVTYNNMVQLGVSINGTMNIKMWQRPMIIQDTFTLVIDSVDKSYLESLAYCPTSNVPHQVTYHTNYINYPAQDMTEIKTFVGDQYQIDSLTDLAWPTVDPDGYVFRFWNLMPDGSAATFHPGYWADNITSDFDLYAIWDSAYVTYTAHYFANNGFPGQEEIVTFKPISGLLILRADFFTAPAGKTFLEWNTADDGSGTSYQAGDIVNLNNDITLYGIWEII